MKIYPGFWAWSLGSGRTPQLAAVVEEGGEGPLAKLKGDGDSAAFIDPGIQVVLLLPPPPRYVTVLAGRKLECCL